MTAISPRAGIRSHSTTTSVPFFWLRLSHCSRSPRSIAHRVRSVGHGCAVPHSRTKIRHGAAVPYTTRVTASLSLRDTSTPVLAQAEPLQQVARSIVLSCVGPGCAVPHSRTKIRHGVAVPYTTRVTASAVSCGYEKWQACAPGTSINPLIASRFGRGSRLPEIKITSAGTVVRRSRA